MMQSTLTRYAFFEGTSPPLPSADYAEIVRTVRGMIMGMARHVSLTVEQLSITVDRPDTSPYGYIRAMLDKPRMRLRIITHVRPRDVDALVEEFRDICDIIAQQCWSKGPHYGYTRVLQ